MLKGTEKRIIQIKNTGSALFDEAYFVINEKTEKFGQYTESEMVREASRIVESSLPPQLSGAKSVRSGTENAGTVKLYQLKWYLAGAGSIVAVFTAIKLISTMFM